jgi:hypothetical protein
MHLCGDNLSECRVHIPDQLAFVVRCFSMMAGANAERPSEPSLRWPIEEILTWRDSNEYESLLIHLAREERLYMS